MANCKYTIYGRTFDNELSLDEYLLDMKLLMDNVKSEDLVMSKNDTWSKDKSNTVRRLHININLALAAINKAGGIHTSELYGPDIDPDYYVKGYMGVSRAMTGYVDAYGKLAFPIFIENNLWNTEFKNLRNGKPLDSIKEYYFDRKGIPVLPVTDEAELNKIRKLFSGRLDEKDSNPEKLGIWPLKGIIGTLIHDVLSDFFIELKGNVNLKKASERIEIINRTLKRNSKRRLKGGLSLIDEKMARQIIDNGFIIADKLRELFGNDLYIKTEVSLIGQFRFRERIDLYNLGELKNHNILGRLDLLVVDKDGGCHIIDFKCSDKNYADYDKAKIKTFNYLLASYRKLLTSLGITKFNDVPSLHVIPIKMNDFNYTDDGKCSFTGISLESDVMKEIDVSSPNINSAEFDAVEKVLDSICRYKKIDDKEVSVALADTDLFMRKCFGEYGKKPKTQEEIKELIDKQYHWDNDPTRKPYKRYKLCHNTHKNQYYFGETELECIEKLNDNLSEGKLRIAQHTEDYIKLIIKALKQKLPLVITNNSKTGSDNSTNNYLTRIFSKYVNPDWEVINTYPALTSMGIIMFQNSITGLVDFKLISSEWNLKRKIKLGGNNSNLIGQFLSDLVVRNIPDSRMMSSTSGNIELIKLLHVINTIAQNFIGTNLRIGELLVISFRTLDSISADNSLILWNYNQLCLLAGLKNNFSMGKDLEGIKMLNYTLLLHNKITEINCGEGTNSRFLKKTKEITIDYKDSFDLEVEGFKRIPAIELLMKLKNDLEEKFPDLRSGKINDIDTNDSPLNYVYIYLMGSLMELNNINPVLQLEDHAKFVLNSISSILTQGLNGSYSDNPGNQLSKILNQIYELCVRAYQNTRDELYKFNTELRDKTILLKKDKGFNYLKRATFGLEASMYKNMYKRVKIAEGKYDLMFKNPFDSSEDLTPGEREYLKFALLNICKLRDGSITTMDSLESKLNDPNGLYDHLLYVPLTRGTTSSKIVSTGGILACIKLKFNELNPKNIIEHLKLELYNVYSEDDEKKIRNKELWEMRTGFERGEVMSDMDTTSREFWIQQMGGINYFETNLELLQLKFKAAHSMKNNMNKVFPLIKSLYVWLLYLGIVTNNKFTNDLQYINDFIISKIFNMPLDSVDKFKLPMLLSLKAMALASKLALAFNPKLLYQHIDGFWKDCLLAFSKPTGATSSLGTEPFTKKNLFDAWMFIKDDLVHFGDSMTMGEGFNMTYGINDMDTNKLAEAMVSDKLGIGNFWSLGFRFSSRPDYYNRLTMFIALMKADKCFDAHHMEGNRLVYDFKKDGRFLHLINNERGAEYDKELGLYITMARQFELEDTLGEDGKPFKLDLSKIDEGKILALPRAYTNKQAESVKALGDKIYGYYSHEKKSLMLSYTLGAVMFLMHTYWSSKKNLYLSGLIFNLEGYYTEYEETTKNEDGTETKHKWYYTLDENGLEVPIRDDQLKPGLKAIPMYVWKGRPLEGILITLMRLVKPTFLPMVNEDGKLLYDPIANFKTAWDSVMHNDDPDMARLYRANLRKLISDLIGWFFIGSLIGGSWLKSAKEKEKETGNTRAFDAFANGANIFCANMLKSSADDFNFVSSIMDVGIGSGPFALGSAKRLYNNTVSWITGDRDTYDTFVKTVSGINSLKPIMDYNKLVILGREIGDNGLEE